MAQGINPNDSFRLGSDVAAIKAKTDPKVWKKLVKYAHSRGYSVRGALTDAPYSLKERTQTSLKAQATKTITDAYAGAGSQLNAQESRVKALDDKRKTDNAAYQQWLLGKQSEYAGQARAAQTQYSAYLDGLKTATADRYQVAQAAAQQAAQGTPGTVSDMSQSTAIKGLGADAAKATGQVDNARQQTAAAIPSIEMMLEASRQGAIGQGQANDAKTTSDTNTALADVADKRFQLEATKASGKVTEFTRLLDQEMTKANANRDFNAAAQKLGLQSAELNNTITQQNRDYKLKTAKFNLDQWKANNSAKLEQAKIQLGYDKLKTTVGQKEADRKLKLYLTDKYGSTTGAPKTTSADKKYSSRLYQAVNTTLGTLTDLHTSHDAKGGYVTPQGPTGPKQTYRQYLRAKGASDTVIDIAEDLRKHGGKLSKAGRQKARNIGILNPEQLWG